MSAQSKSPVRSAPSPEANSPRVTRRLWLGITAAGVASVFVGGGLMRGRDLSGDVAPVGGAGPLAADRHVTVYKSPTCGCCEKWIEYMEKDGFTVAFEDMDNVVPVKQRRGVPQELWSCHTSLIGDYTFEGHVPADLIRKVLAENAPVAGLAVAGMPPSAPGMDQGSSPYEVKSFTRNGKVALYAVR